MLQACDGRGVAPRAWPLGRRAAPAGGVAAALWSLARPPPSGAAAWPGRVSARARHGARDGGATSRVAIRVQRPAKAAGGSTGAGAADEASLRFPTRPRSQALKVMGEGVSAARWEQ